MEDIQFADSLISEISSMGADNIFVMASPTAILPDAAALRTAMGDRSPIDIASPCLPK